MALTELGFSRRTYDEILSDKIERAKELFGEDIETSELTPLGKFIRINAYDQALTEEEAERIYYSIFPNTATGISLDRLCTFVGLSRNPSTAARYEITLNGDAGSVVPQGFLVGTNEGVTYATNEERVISHNGTATIEVDCTIDGEIGNVDERSISVIVNPLANVDGITSAKLLISGKEAESDYSLRQRFAITRDGLGSCTEASIVSAIMRIDTVESAGIITDDDMHTFECFVDGGEDYHKEIAEAIFAKKPIGIKTQGNESYDVTDASGGSYTIYFSHTGKVEVSIKVSIKVNSSYAGSDGEEEIQRNIMARINSLGIGGNVILSALYGEIYKVAGVTEVTALLCALDGGEWSTYNVIPSEYEKCTCSSVTVEVVEE